MAGKATPAPPVGPALGQASLNIQEFCTKFNAATNGKEGVIPVEIIVADDKSYELVLPTDEMFVKVHGEIKLHYTVYEDKNIVLLTNITPEGILEEGHRAELTAYKGVMISKANPEKDMFKINLLNMMQNK